LRTVLAFFHPPRAAPALSDPDEVRRLYRHYRVRILYSLLIGYALFYFCRKNYSIIMPAMARELALTNTQLGLIGGLLYVTYGIGKLVNGALGDHVDSRRFLVLGLLLSAVANLVFSDCVSVGSLALWWALNGWFQSMGFPPCARLLSHWYSVSERGRTWALWNTSHQLGGFAVAGLVGILAAAYGWRSGFIIPALLCIAGCVFLWERLRDTPKSLGLPPIDRYRDDYEHDASGRVISDEPETLRQILFTRVLRSRAVWLVSLFNFFVYWVRSGAFDFATKFLAEQKGIPLRTGGVVTSAFELLGIPGSLLAGLLVDRYLRGQHARVSCAAMLLVVVALIAFYYIPAQRPWLDGAALGLLGFAIYGPQFLVGVFAADLASRKAAATAIGLTGVFGYAGSFLSNVVSGKLIDRYGWRGAFIGWIVAAVLGALFTLPLFRINPRAGGARTS
jgi:OPA family sugar phosphate sensor protein UhpC-like MFS transporter